MQVKHLGYCLACGDAQLELAVVWQGQFHTCRSQKALLVIVIEEENAAVQRTPTQGRQ